MTGRSCLTLRAAAVLSCAALASAAPCRAQDASAWTAAAAGLALSAATDARLSAFARSHHDRALDEGAKALAPIGEARYLVPALAGAAVVTRLAAPRPAADAALRIALSYAAADGVESVLKPLVGRHRPSDGHGPWRFHAFRNDEQWHSFPSAHVAHTFSLATGLALETRQRWVAIPAFGVASLVGAQRVYTGAHWGSDVVGSAAMAIGVAAWTDATLRRRGLRHVLGPADAREVVRDGSAEIPGRDAGLLTIEAGLRGVAVRWTF